MPDQESVAVVTGGGSGMGLASAARLGRRHRILVAEPSAERAEAAERTLRAEGIDAHGAVCDVTDAGAVAALAARAEELGPLAALVHAAGLSRSMASARRIMEVNLCGAARVLDAFLPLAGPGSVGVCVASNGAYRRSAQGYDEQLRDPLRPGFLDELEETIGLDGREQAAYDLSKRGLVAMVERRAHAWGERGARLVSVSPGLIETPMGRLELQQGGNDRIASWTALGRLGVADEIASVVEFLCSPGAAYVTGCDVVVDGGMLAGINHHLPEKVRTAYHDAHARRRP